MQRHKLIREGAYLEENDEGNWVLHSDAASQIAELERRLALAVAEVKAWRQADLRHDWIRDNTAGGVAATREVDNLICEMNATDADLVLRAMIEKGSVT